MPTKKQLANLRPIKPGERRAAKADKKKRNNDVVVKFTDDELARVNQLVKNEGYKNRSALIRDKIGIDK